MSCPDWTALGPRGPEDSLAWRVALEHYDRCTLCRDAALAAEPTLLFRQLPMIAVPDADVAAMRAAVRNLRRAEAIEQRPRQARRRTMRWLRAAALAASVAGASLFLRGGGVVVEPPIAHNGAVADTVVADLTLDLSHLPLIEDVDASLGSVIQVVDDDFAVVVVEMHEKSDV